MTKLIISLQELLTTSTILPATVEIDLDAELAKQKQIAIFWHIEDVQEERPNLTNDQAWEVLQTVKREHDATIGINWQTLRYHADELFPEQPNLFGKE